MENLFPILLGTILINNLALTKLVSIGQLANFGDNEDQTLTLGLSAAVIMAVSSILSYVAFTFILDPLGVTVLNLLVYVLIVLLVTMAVTGFVKSRKPEMYEAVGKVLPLIAVNSSILYLILDMMNQGMEFLPMLFTSIGAPIGLLFAFVLYGAVRERLAVSDTPKAFRGLPILLIYAALALMALSGLNGII
ncbi:Rnf-Nqr domain containing protein [Proteiniclasticum sp. C24MP]|uniref:Rnf-Nqr domain containing protein n=1 Tax=Proteiniclasticum sp. C24MP TaxID=3374101 RepID=UPI0037544362